MLLAILGMGDPCVKRWILIDLSGLYQWPKALTHLLMIDMNCLALGIHILQIMGATSKCFLLLVLNVPLLIHPPVEVVYSSSRHTIRPIWPWWTRLSALLLHICVYQFLFPTEFRLIVDSGSRCCSKLMLDHCIKYIYSCGLQSTLERHTMTQGLLFFT